MLQLNEREDTKADVYRRIEQLLAKHERLFLDKEDFRAAATGLPTPSEIRKFARQGFIQFPKFRPQRILKQKRRQQKPKASPKRWERLKAIAAAVAASGGPIPVEVASHIMGLSRSAGWPYLSQLEDMGFVIIHRVPRGNGVATVEVVEQ